MTYWQDFKFLYPRLLLVTGAIVVAFEIIKVINISFTADSISQGIGDLAEGFSYLLLVALLTLIFCGVAILFLCLALLPIAKYIYQNYGSFAYFIVAIGLFAAISIALGTDVGFSIYPVKSFVISMINVLMVYRYYRSSKLV